MSRKPSSMWPSGAMIYILWRKLSSCWTIYRVTPSRHGLIVPVAAAIQGGLLGGSAVGWAVTARLSSVVSGDIFEGELEGEVCT